MSRASAQFRLIYTLTNQWLVICYRRRHLPKVLLDGIEPKIVWMWSQFLVHTSILALMWNKSNTIVLKPLDFLKCDFYISLFQWIFSPRVQYRRSNDKRAVVWVKMAEWLPPYIVLCFSFNIYYHSGQQC